MNETFNMGRLMAFVNGRFEFDLNFMLKFCTALQKKNTFSLFDLKDFV